MAFAWDPTKYQEFGSFRDRPFFDLTARITAQHPRTVVDLGCGPGNLTRTLAERWPDAEVVGLDSSPEMIERATFTQCEGEDALPNLSFAVARAQDWQPDERTDVLISNALLQWVPEHRELLPQWYAAMPQGSWLAFQVPGNFNAPSHALMREVAESPRWRQQLGSVLRSALAVAEPEDYLALALDAGWLADSWETTYQQVLQGEDPVLQWVRGTGLRPVLGALNADDTAEFEAEYSARLREAYPQRIFGTVYPFRRIFQVAQKP